jgi:Ca2+-binding EF-hand superfamily protein
MVDIEAFKSAMCALGDKMKPSEINTILKDAGWDGEDSISHQDLLKLIQNIA